jgi:signal transduction histidine kinase
MAANRFEDIPRFMDAASTSALRAAALTHRLLAFARRQSLDSRPNDINRLIAGMQELLQRTMGERIELVCNLAGDLWAAFTDANQLESALLNLVINARDAMPEGGRLTIETANVQLDKTHTALHAGSELSTERLKKTENPKIPVLPRGPLLVRFHLRFFASGQRC